jgi:hypothetical protein
MLAAVVVLLYLGTLVLAVFLLLLYRQFGLLAIGSAEAVRLPGPRPGRVVRRAPVPLLDRDGMRRPVRLAARERLLFVLFVLPGSPFDAEIAAAARAFAERLAAPDELLVVSRASLDPAFAAAVGDGVTMLVDPDGALFDALDLKIAPYMFAVDREGVLLLRDIVNDLAHLDRVREEAAERDAERSQVGR